MKMSICAQTQRRDKKDYFYVSNKQMLRLKKYFRDILNQKQKKKKTLIATCGEEIIPT